MFIRVVAIFFCTLWLWGKSSTSYSQNLVVDPGFENIINCPTGQSDWTNVADWQNAVPTADIFNTCNILYAGSVQPRNGDGYVGLSVYRGTWTNYREYVGSYLSSPLQAGNTYSIEFWVLLAPGKCWASNSLGAYLSSGPPTSTSPQVQPVTAQVIYPANQVVNDQLNWTRVSGTFTATGGEQYILIGGFRDDNNSNFTLTNCGTTNYGVHWSYYLIDDVTVEQVSVQLNPSITVSDSAICAVTCINFDYTGTPADSLSWSFPGAIPSSDTSQSPQNICYQMGGAFTASVTAYLNGDSAVGTQFISVGGATPPLPFCVWEGNEDRNWFNSCNWQNNSIPDTISHVVIPGGTPYEPIISLDTGYCQHITILWSNGASLDIDVAQGGFLIKKP